VLVGQPGMRLPSSASVEQLASHGEWCLALAAHHTIICYLCIFRDFCVMFMSLAVLAMSMLVACDRQLQARKVLVCNLASSNKCNSNNTRQSLYITRSTAQCVLPHDIQ
jgi:hypothetical protein